MSLLNKLRSSQAGKISNADIVQEAAYLSLLRQLRSMGPQVYPELDLVGRHIISGVIAELESEFQERFHKWNKQ